jgi:radical S-adenosyl methionine domain-containing protein 2
MTAATTVAVPIAVNFHLWPKCNLRCTFCYAGFPEARKVLEVDDAKALITALCEAGTEKITFVGGEPTLHPHLAQLVRHAHGLGLTTCVVTNGARLPKLLDDCAGQLDWVGLSVDSGLESVQAKLGRGAGDHIGNSIAHADELRRRAIRIKLNTVVTALNWQEDMSELVRLIRPDRWKAFQVLEIQGENEGKVGPLLISADQYAQFVARHQHLAAEGLGLVPEDNDAMRGSYVMINPQGQFFTNEHGRYVVSKPILAVGVEQALASVRWRQDKFVARGGLYDWQGGKVTAGRQQIIAIEGLDGTGKSTTVALLAKRLGARIIRNPPEELAGERAAIDQEDDTARRAWYLNANRTAMQMALDVKHQPVVLDRSVASTLAFGAAERGEIATRTDMPADFELPDAIVLLSLPESVRRARHAHRGDAATGEEGRLAADGAFRERVLAGYANLSTAVVDAAGTPEEVVDAVVAAAVAGWR